jgi:hypothetical protein
LHYLYFGLLTTQGVEMQKGKSTEINLKLLACGRLILAFGRLKSTKAMVNSLFGLQVLSRASHNKRITMFVWKLTAEGSFWFFCWNKRNALQARRKARQLVVNKYLQQLA